MLAEEIRNAQRRDPVFIYGGEEVVQETLALAEEKGYTTFKEIRQDEDFWGILWE